MSRLAIFLQSFAPKIQPHTQQDDTSDYQTHHDGLQVIWAVVKATAATKPSPSEVAVRDCISICRHEEAEGGERIWLLPLVAS